MEVEKMVFCEYCLDHGLPDKLILVTQRSQYTVVPEVAYRDPRYTFLEVDHVELSDTDFGKSVLFLCGEVLA